MIKKNIIIWIDGAYGVGKTAVALKVKEKLPEYGIEILESDCYMEETLKEIIEEAKKNNCFPNLGGTLPQNNIRFIEKFKGIIEEKLKKLNERLIIDMALTKEECKESLFDYLQSVYGNILHIILMADEEVIKSRILNDNRDKYTALENLKDNISFLNKNFNDAVWINTNNKSIDNIANEIIKLIKD